MTKVTRSSGSEFGKGSSELLCGHALHWCSVQALFLQHPLVSLDLSSSCETCGTMLSLIRKQPTWADATQRCSLGTCSVWDCRGFSRGPLRVGRVLLCSVSTTIPKGRPVLGHVLFNARSDNGKNAPFSGSGWFGKPQPKQKTTTKTKAHKSTTRNNPTSSNKKKQRSKANNARRVSPCDVRPWASSSSDSSQGSFERSPSCFAWPRRSHGHNPMHY